MVYSLYNELLCCNEMSELLSICNFQELDKETAGWGVQGGREGGTQTDQKTVYAA